MANTDQQYIHALRSIDGIGNGTVHRLIAHFGNGEQTWLASPEMIDALPDIDPKRKSAIIAGRHTIDPSRLWEQLANLGITLYTRNDPLYPALLKEIPDSPATLYTRGNFNWEKRIPYIAIVGSRKHSSYGVQVAEKLAEDLVRAGIVVVSGMAFGIDSVAHRGAMEGDGETIAILGSGIDDHSLTPMSHFQLAQKIMTRGALASEYPPGTPATPGSFALRNRIIAGLCLGTVVIEAGEKSGSLITARCALDYNREVFAIPGSILSPYSLGTNALLKRGAKIVTGVSDILEELLPEALAPASQHTGEADTPSGLSPEEERILTVLTHEPLHVDKIIQVTALSARTVGSLLSLLEIKGLAKNLGGMHYVRV